MYVRKISFGTTSDMSDLFAWAVFVTTTFPDDYEGSQLASNLDKKTSAPDPVCLSVAKRIL